MSRINTNVQSLIAQTVLTQNQTGLSTSLERLSTGLRINRGKDDPAGLIASENLRSEKTSLSSAIDNANRADQVANIAEGGLSEVSSMLTQLQGLVTNTANNAGLSDSEKKANQLQIDSILQTIDRVSGSTTFQGKGLLNGSLDYNTTNVSSSVTDFSVNAAKLTKGSNLAVQAIVTASAQQAGLFLSAGGSSLNFGGNAAGVFTIEVAGSKGSRQLSFSSGTTLTQVAAAVNSFTDVTGAQASVSGTGLKLSSQDYGSSQFVSVRTVGSTPAGLVGSGIYQLNGTNFNATTGSATSYSTATNGVRDSGQDIGVNINGVKATSDGKTARVNTDFLDVQVTLGNTASQTLGAVNAFTITGGGADFQLAGKVDISGKVALGIGNIATRNLGNSALGYLSSLASGQSNNVVSGDLTAAQKIVTAAIDQVSTTRGRLGAFQANTVGSTIRSLGVSLENITAAESSIRDANFATETANMTRNQILVSSATKILSVANAAPQSALQLLQ